MDDPTRYRRPHRAGPLFALGAVALGAWAWTRAARRAPMLATRTRDRLTHGQSSPPTAPAVAPPGL
ncbi:MAG TPA: hypothetical protein VF649_11505 [Sphingomonas sp.]|jgi:hypothetical protein|uniref:hypothetical protein n=1 Tax=Sphingomonas sp. TaxID=28214 RepID=UPI002ED7A9E4